MNEVKLYINNQLIEFQTSPDILFTYQVDDLTNPTIVKNSYTKTITIPGTKQNNIIFDSIWNVERIQTDENFNVTKRAPFTLYINGDIYQTGYVKLDKVTKQNNKYEYSITLYGGLGSFLYNLSIDWNTGDKKTLADLDYHRYPGSSESIDLGFTINKDTVASAWTEINSSEKWGVVNFAPTYIGHPDKISCDKVLINFKDAPLNSGVTSGDTVFTPSQGYSLGTLPQELTSEEVRDYRSYIQTPVIRVKSIFEALCEKSNNKGRYDDGYEVELDRDFFTSTNPYYWDSWVTLPTITNLEFSNEGGGGGETTAYTGNYYVETLTTINEDTTTVIFPLDAPITGGNYSVKMTIDLGVTGNTSADNLYMYYYKRIGRGTHVYYRKGYGLQLYASNSLSLNENALAGSNVKWISGEEKYNYADAVSSRQFTPKWNTNTVENHTGRFTKVSGSTYHFSGGLLELYCDLPIGSTCFKLVLGKCNSSNNEERSYLTTSTAYYDKQDVLVKFKPFQSSDIELSTIDSGESISNRYISKEMLLATSYSPADFLLSYCKRFGLYINKDAVENKIYIRTRNNYFKRDEVVNIEKEIDYSKQFLINPVYCENGYLSLTDEGVESKSFKDYEQKTGKVYGQKIINTGYEFNADTKELNDKSIFKGSIQTKDVSQYYAKPSSLSLQPYVYNGLKYNLYANGDFSASTFEYSQPVNEISDVCEPFNNEYPNYDYIGKPIFTDGEGKSLDTENVLLFFNGYETVPSSYKWYLTDDLAYMYKLNNNPTWLLTVSEYDLMGNKIANAINRFPKFGRWLEGNRWMIYSWDYGSPRMLYVPDFTNNDEGNIYHNYFKKYYEDLYDVDTKAVDTYMLGDFNEDDMRKFYWFRNSIWRLNKITDFNPTNHDTTKVQFIKVQDLNNMTNEDATNELWIEVTLDRYILPVSGGTILGTVTTSDNYGWHIESITYTSTDSAYTITVDPMGYGSSGNFNITADTNNTYDDIIVTIVVSSGDISKSVSFTQLGMDASNTYFTFQCVSGNNIPIVVARQDYSAYLPTNTGSIMIKKNNGNWQRLFTYDPSYGNDGYNATAEFTMSAGDVVMVKATYDITGGTPFIGYVWGRFYHEFHIAPNYVYNNIDIRVYGNALSLLYADSFRDYTEFPNTNGGYVFANLFSTGVGVEKGGLTSAKKLVLPTENLTPYCYSQLLSENWGLKDAPKLPSTHLAEGCYAGMFNGCTSLTTLPELPATTLALGCYDSMFMDCYSLRTIPSDYLPATNLAPSCYGKMFSSCTSIKTTPHLPADVLAEGCYASMFAGCASLTTVRDLPATHLAPYCYSGMFSSAFIGSASTSCTALTNVPKVLPATELEEGCYNRMFQGCTSLTKAPELPAITLVSTSSYSYPEGACYGRMFDGCSSLNYIKCLAVERRPEDNTYATIDWVSGVSQNGVFIANPAATTTGSDATWRIIPAYSNIPYGWVYQGSNVNRIEIKNLVWVNNIPSSGGTANSGNCSFNVIAYMDNNTTGDITTVCTISGSKVIGESYNEEEHAAGLLNITAMYMGLVANSSVEVIQDAYESLVLTGIGFNNVQYIVDVPASGGTVTSGDCNFTIYGYYTGGFYGHFEKDITSESTITGSLEVPSSFIEEVHYIDSALTLTATYSGFTVSESFDVYQQAFVPTITGITIYAVQIDYVPASGGTVSYSNGDFECSVYANYDNGATTDITSSSVISSDSLVIPSSYIEEEHSAGTLTLTAIHQDFTDSIVLTIWQDKFIVEVTGLTINNLIQTSYIPASGGTAYSGNCSFTISAYYNNETVEDITSSAIVYGEVVIPLTEVETIHSAGTLTLSTTYSGVTTSASTSIYQEGNSLISIIFNGLEWVTDVPASGGTADSGNCYFTLDAYYSNGTSIDRKNSATINGSISVPAATGSTRENIGTLILNANYLNYTATDSVVAYQAAPTLTGISIDNFMWVTDVPASGGTADSGNCSFNVIARYDNMVTEDITSVATISGSVNISATTATTRENVGTLILTISYSSFTSTVSTPIYQEGLILELTGITLENLTWVTDIPASGGTADSGNCSFNVIAHYNNTTTENVTYRAIISGSVNISATTATTRENVGTLLLTATYSGFTATGTTTIYQMPTDQYLTFEILSAGTISWHFISGSSSLQYSKNGGNWTNLSGSLSVSVGDLIRLRASDVVGNFSGSTAGFNVYGNIMSLISTSDFGGITAVTTSGRFQNMFNNCKKLVSASNLQLPATSISDSCYRGMFVNCTGLTSAPELPATTIGQYCYAEMFSSCSSLSAVPTTLPATTLSKGCYNQMFSDCPLITTAPELPAPTTVQFCYQYMFVGCSSLNRIKCLATDISAGNDTDMWVADVAATGTFVKAPSMAGWETGNNGIPSGWTVQDAT